MDGVSTLSSLQRFDTDRLVTGKAYCQHAGGGLSHRHRQHARKIGTHRARGFRDILADRQTDILITVLCNCSRRQSNNMLQTNIHNTSLLT